MLEAGDDIDIPLSLELEDRFQLDEAVVVSPNGNSTDAVGHALGSFLSQTIGLGMTVGVGWGRALDAALKSFNPAKTQDLVVCSLLGGIVELNTRNPVEFAWRFAELAGARCLLMLSPLLLDSAETRRRLTSETELTSLFTRAGQLDIAVLGCGDPREEGNSTMMALLSPQSRRNVREAGAVADVLCQFLTQSGEEIGIPEGDRLMAVDLASIAKAKSIILATGGPGRAPALVAACRRFQNVTLVTDSQTAAEMLTF